MSHYYGLIGFLFLGVSVAGGCGDSAGSSDASDTAVVTDTASAADTASPGDTASAADTLTGADVGEDTAVTACNTLVNDGAVISKTGHAEAPPAMTGGTIADGTYVLTALDQYNGHHGDTTHKEKWAFSGSSVLAVSAEGGGDVRYAGTYSTAGNVLTLSITCPGPATISALYTATASTLVTEVPDKDDHQVSTYTMQ